MFLPKTLTDRANQYVEGQGDRAPRFKSGVGIRVRPSGDILRYSSTTPQSSRRVTAVGAAYFRAKDTARARRQAVAKKAPQRSTARLKVPSPAQMSAFRRGPVAAR